MIRFLCALTGHRWNRVMRRDRNAFFDVVTLREVAWWTCGCGRIFMADGRWSGFRVEA